MGPQRGNVQAIVQNICLWTVLGNHWPQACACAPPTATCPQSRGQELALCLGAGPGTYLWPWCPSSLLGKEYLLRQQPMAGFLSRLFLPHCSPFSFSLPLFPVSHTQTVIVKQTTLKIHYFFNRKKFTH